MQIIRNVIAFLWNILVLAVLIWGGWKLFTSFSFGEILKFGALLALVIFVVWYNVVRIKAARFERAEAEYREIQARYGSAAPAHCAHRYFSFSQTGVPGVVTMTRKWCKICKSDLGPATLKESIFGKRWE